MTATLFMILAVVGTAASTVIGVLWGGWSQPMTVLCIMMALDYASGVAVALVFKASPKTESGGMSSLIGLKGLLRKLFLILLVAAAYQVDRMIGANYIRDAVAIAFIANEALSLLENAGLMGIKLPKALITGIEVLKGKAEALPEGKETAEAEEKPPDGGKRILRSAQNDSGGNGETAPHPSPAATPSAKGGG